jgi:hypothetical protein
MGMLRDRMIEEMTLRNFAPDTHPFSFPVGQGNTPALRLTSSHVDRPVCSVPFFAT